VDPHHRFFHACKVLHVDKVFSTSFDEISQMGELLLIFGHKYDMQLRTPWGKFEFFGHK
jgi:hypothetical protein